MKRISQLFKNRYVSSAFKDVSFSYILTGLNILNGIFLLPVYLKYVSKTDYGIWLATGNSIAMISVIGGGFDLVLLQRLSKIRAKGLEARKVLEFSSGLVITIAFSTIIFLLSIALIPVFLKVFQSGHEQIVKVIVLSVAGVSIQLVYLNIKALILSELKPTLPGIAESAARLAGIAVTVVMVMCGFNILSFAVGQLVYPLLSLLGLIVLRWDEIRGSITFKVPIIYYKSQFREYYPSLIGRSGNIIINNIQIPLVASFLNLETAANYGITNRVFDSLNLLINPLKKAVIPVLTARIFSKRTDRRFEHLIFKKYYSWTALVLILILAPIYLFLPDVICVWVGCDFFIGMLVSALLVLIIFVQSIQGFQNSFIISYGYRFQLAWLSIIEMGFKLLVLLGIWLAYRASAFQVYMIPLLVLIPTIFSLFMQGNLIQRKKLTGLMGTSQINLLSIVAFIIVILLIYALR